ncbi:MAG: glycerate kinase [Lentisphaerae bacterium]|nr:glycerate kinase [Lentisphaerota bacterium]
MKVIVAPDSYKGALRAPEVAAAFAAGWQSVYPQDEIVSLPLSDGGEGMMNALCSALDGKIITLPAHDALNRPISAHAAVAGDIAVVESAEANGIELLDRSELDPLAATTYGVGELIKQLLDRGIRKFLIGIGGSATVDGGAGMLQALGAQLMDDYGNILPAGAGGGALRNVAKVQLTTLDPRLTECDIKVACDVTNPLCGITGAAQVFGPQKGATPEMVTSLDENLRRFAALADDDGTQPGDGAAGGLGFALRKFLHASMASGAKLVMEYSGFEAALTDAELVVTGEGCSDEQTACGKLCAGVAQAAHERNVPVILFSGALRGDTAKLTELFDGCFSIASGPGDLSEAIAATAENLRRAGVNCAKLMHLKDKYVC